MDDVEQRIYFIDLHRAFLLLIYVAKICRLVWWCHLSFEVPSVGVTRNRWWTVAKAVYHSWADASANRTTTMRHLIVRLAAAFSAFHLPPLTRFIFDKKHWRLRIAFYALDIAGTFSETDARNKAQTFTLPLRELYVELSQKNRGHCIPGNGLRKYADRLEETYRVSCGGLDMNQVELRLDTQQQCIKTSDFNDPLDGWLLKDQWSLFALPQEESYPTLAVLWRKRAWRGKCSAQTQSVG